MRRNLCVVGLLLAAAASAAGACLIQPPSLRSVDLASVRGGNPPPCVYTQLMDTCDDVMNACKQWTTQVGCVPVLEDRLCSGCSRSVMMNNLASGQPNKTVLSFSTPVQVDCGNDRSNPKCRWNEGECKCEGNPLPVGCIMFKWSILNQNCQ